MFWEFKRVVDLLKPTHVLIENVTGLKSMDNGSFLVAISEALNQAGEGTASSIGSSTRPDFGVPQTRERSSFSS